MKKLYLKDVLKLLADQVGYKEKGTNITKYAKFFDTPKSEGGAWQYFNTKKQGSQWCSEMLHYVVYMCSDAERCRKFFNEPQPKDNCGAGVKFLCAYLNAYEIDIKDIKAGDIVVFKTKNSSTGHVGMCISVDDKINTIEGNKNDSVKRCSYVKNSSKITHVFRPLYDKESNSDKPTIKAAPAKGFKSTFKGSYILERSLKLQSLNKNNDVITTLEKGSEVRCYGFFTGDYLYVTNGKYEGYIYRYGVKKI